MKLKAIVAAVALVAAGMANAALTQNSASTGSSLYFEAYDSVSGIGMVQGLNSQTFQSALTMGTLSTTLDAASFASLLGTDTSGAGLHWQVFASSNISDQVYSGFGILTTITTLPGAAFNMDSSQLASLQVSTTTHLDDINAVLGTATFGTIAASNAANMVNVGSNYSGNLIGGNSTLTGFGSMAFYSITNDPNTFAVLYNGALGSAGGNQKFTLASNGLLTFNDGTPPTVPLPAAAWLFGSGLLGLVGIGRRRK